ncbi:hypothetical protein GCM10027431_31420 [Lysobacter rhizosphaerae]
MRQLFTVSTAVVIASLALPLFCSIASAQTPAPAVKKGIIVQGGREAIGPKQDDPRAVTANDCSENPIAQGGKPGTDDPAAKQGIIVQGGLEAIGPKQDDPRSAAASSTSMRAIGPKQDDPRAATGCQRRKTKT